MKTQRKQTQQEAMCTQYTNKYEHHPNKPNKQQHVQVTYKYENTHTQAIAIEFSRM